MKAFYFLSHLGYNKKQLMNCTTYKWRFSFGCQILKLYSGHCQPAQYDESGRRLVCLSVLSEPVSFQTGAGTRHTSFIRSKGELSLTSAGVLYVEAAQKVVKIQKDLYQNIAALSQKGRIRVGVTSNWGLRMLTEIIPLFREQYPGITIEITETSLPAFKRH